MSGALLSVLLIVIYRYISFKSLSQYILALCVVCKDFQLSFQITNHSDGSKSALRVESGLLHSHIY